MGLEQPPDAVDHRLYFAGRGVTADADEWMKPVLVARRQRLQAHVGDLPVGDADDGAVGGANACGAEADVVDRSDNLPDLERIPDADRLIEDQRGAGDDVLECLLGRERHGDAADAESGERRRCVDAVVTEERQQPAEHQQHIDHAPADTQERRRRCQVRSGKRRRTNRSASPFKSTSSQTIPTMTSRLAMLDQNCRTSSGSGSRDSVQRIASARISSRTGAGQHVPIEEIGLRGEFLPDQADERRENPVEQDGQQVEERHAENHDDPLEQADPSRSRAR